VKWLHLGVPARRPGRLVKWLHLGVPARQAPLGASWWSAAVPAQRDSPVPPDSRLEVELRVEMFVALREAEEIARAKSTQARVSIGRH
jgi:hypothetical protein